MNNEGNRLRTFSNWPCDAPVSAERLARAGFYYTGLGLEVQCFLCSTRITEWNYGDQAVVRHRLAAPDCPFVLNPSATCNAPSISSSNDKKEFSPLNARSSSIKINHPLLLRIEELNRNYGTIRQRLDTFENCSISGIVLPQKLAEAGFFYLGERDMVACVFCRGIIYQWEPGSNPDREHRIHFPTCNFYLRQDDGNVNDDIAQLTNINLISGLTTNFKDLGIQAHTLPQNQDYSSYETRLTSYTHWPTDHSQTPEMLAKAGFYYIGYKDHVRCYHCDGGLHCWENTDDPWVEHAKWFPKCGFVNLSKTIKFITKCVEDRPPAEGIIEENNRDTRICQINQPDDFSASPIDTENKTVVNTTEAEVISQGTENSTIISEKALSETESPATIQSPSATKLPATTRSPSSTESSSSTEQNILSSNRRYHVSDEVMPDEEMAEIVMAMEANRIPKERGTVCNDSCTQEEFTRRILETLDEDYDRQSETKEHPNSSPTTEISDSNDEPIEKETNADSEASSTSLEEENRKLKEARLCKVCMDREIAVVFLPCGHFTACGYCASPLAHCPICRKKIHATVRAFLS